MKLYRYSLVLLFILSLLGVSAQGDTTKRVKVAVFIPMHVDDVLNGTDYTTIKSLPKGVLPGLEFYNGVMMAIDSLQQEGLTAELAIYDTKKAGLSLEQFLKSNELNNVGLIIAVISNQEELKVFSSHALAKNVPVISATYPNYAGVTANPFFVLLNSSFQAHLQGLYNHMKKYYSSNPIIAVTKKGATEDYVKSYISRLNSTSSSAPLKLKWINVDEATFTSAEIYPALDSTRENIVFVASPSESFGLKVVRTLAQNDAYPVTAIGMPTWDGIKELDRRDCRNVNIVFSTPFLYNSRNASLSVLINERYKDKYYSRPSDMVYKGFETVLHFTKLLIKHNSNLVNNLSDKDYTVFNAFELQPVKLQASSIRPDLIENKKLYFVKKQQGNVKSVY